MDEHGPDAPWHNETDETINRHQQARGLAALVTDSLYGGSSNTRKYLPTLAELIDRLTIVQLKMIYISENADAYKEEMALIQHDIDMMIEERPISAGDIRAIAMLMLTNRVIWENESRARLGGDEQDALLKFTHSINGVRTQAKNVIARNGNERVELKVDSLAASLPEEFGNWRVF